MKKRLQGFAVAILISSLGLILFSGCSKGTSENSSQYSGPAYYDQYEERPGYYDFGRPVIFLPDGGNVAR